MKKLENLLAYCRFAALVLLVFNIEVRAAQSTRTITASALTPTTKTVLFGDGKGLVKLISLARMLYADARGIRALCVAKLDAVLQSKRFPVRNPV